MIAPAVEEVAEDFDGRAVVGKVDVDEQAELARRFGIMSIPTLIVRGTAKWSSRRSARAAKRISPQCWSAICKRGKRRFLRRPHESIKPVDRAFEKNERFFSFLAG